MVKFKVDVAGALAKLRRGRELDQGELLSVMGTRLLRWVDDNFRVGGLEAPWVPVKHGGAPLQDTGTLRRSFVQARVAQDAVLVGTVNRVAPFHHFGSRPHVIRAVRARALRFVVGGRVVFAKSVQHPGLPPRRLLPTRATAELVTSQAVDASIEAHLG